MAITRTDTTDVIWAEINDQGSIDLNVRAELRDVVAARALTPAEALQLADELRELATEAASYAAEAKA